MSQWAPTGGRASCRVSSAAADANGADKPHLLRGATGMRHSGRRCIVDGHARQHPKAPAQEIRTSNSDPLKRRTNNMKSRAFRRTRLAAAVGAALLSLSAGSAFGSAFALQEQNASGLGHAYAGGAAAAEDVSTIFFNPAGLVRLQTTQIVVAGNIICPSSKFHDNGSQPAGFGQPLGGTGGDAGSCAAVPNLYVGVPCTDRRSL